MPNRRDAVGFHCHFPTKSNNIMRKQLISVLLLLGAVVVAAQDDTLTWQNDTMLAADTTVQVQEMNGVAATAPDTPASVAPAPMAERPSTGLGWLVLATGLATLLAVGGGVLAFLTRRELADLQETYNQALEQTNENVSRLAEQHVQEMAAMQQQVTRLTAAVRSLTDAKPRPARQRSESPAPAGPQTLYLAKPDDGGAFSRVSAQFELGNSLFVLTTTDGVHGSFAVIDNADVHRCALMMPTENLTRACAGDAIQRAAGMTRIVTDQPGEAVMDNGAWRVTRKATIHYE